MAAAQGQARDSDIRVCAAGGLQTEGLSLDVKVDPDNSGFSAGSLLHRVHPYALHGRQVNHESTVTNGVSGEAVPNAPHREQQIVNPSEIHRIDDIRRTGATDDDGRLAVDHGVPDGAHFIVSVVSGQDHLTAQLPIQLLNYLIADDGFGPGKNDCF